MEIVCNCDFLLAFWNGESKGTKFTIEYANKIGKPFKIIMTWQIRRNLLYKKTPANYRLESILMILCFMLFHMVNLADNFPVVSVFYKSENICNRLVP